jgi:hypothetical protein
VFALELDVWIAEPAVHFDRNYPESPSEVGSRKRDRLISAEAVKDHILRVAWSGGLGEEIDLVPLLYAKGRYPALRRDAKLFSSARVAVGGGWVEWDDGSLVRAAELSELQTAIMSNAGFKRSMDVLAIGHEGMAARLGVSRRLVARWRKDTPIPRHVAMAVRFMTRALDIDLDV